MAEVIFYYTEKGNSEVEKVLTELNESAKKGNRQATAALEAIEYSIDKVEHGMPHTRQLQGPLYEIRAKRYRITYFRWEGYIVLLTIFVKSTQQTPKAEIDRARKRMKDWVAREGS
ncbi:type II toxin-antitoxin system RelE/ParE family toxin [Paenibacillus gallinarum]|uniref:Type II toxin-antitoxin system RelE/ParE family toxin n=1 Tax=Paenibacillus gallinarum TaxID=2762232 RepID=A0ABR8T3U1_9BACL|nr:type II toxin-antitoxin system RelE/ParE family toxin [Paenibacillus gallinarum]MBD7970249.1 type II toxin-antitoxin system RelE/ParE family toxin [Paenibacillus gallinarum]